MKETLKYKVLSTLRMVICKLTGHEYGCCTKVLERCSKCIYIREDSKS